jgi:hypothetical protein
MDRCSGMLELSAMEITPALSLFDMVKICENDAIYRYMSVSELGCLCRGELWMTCPFRWANMKDGDTWENLLYQTTIVGADGRELKARLEGRKIYAQCWTTCPESDAMWRLYTKAGEGVKIKMRAGALLQAVQGIFDSEKHEMIIFKIGRVSYFPDTELDSEFGSLAQFRDKLQTPHEATLAKRDAYEHEEEVRLVAYDFDDRNRRLVLRAPNLKRPSTNPRHPVRRHFLVLKIDASKMCDLIEEVVISPRLSPEKVDSVTRTIVGLGVRQDKIAQSRLYGRREIRVLQKD